MTTKSAIDIVREAKETQNEREFNAKRLRRVVNLLGLDSAVPEDNETLLGCIGSVLGMVARKIEESMVDLNTPELWGLIERIAGRPIYLHNEPSAAKLEHYIARAAISAQPVINQQAVEPVAWYDPSNKEPGQSVTFDRNTAEHWPHLYPVALYTAPVAQAESKDAAEKVGIQKAFDNISRHIKPGQLQGNGCDETAQRNGMVLAANIVGQLLSAPDSADSEG